MRAWRVTLSKSPILQPGLRGLFTSDSIGLCCAETWHVRGYGFVCSRDTGKGAPNKCRRCCWDTGSLFPLCTGGLFSQDPLLSLPFETGPYSSPVLFSFCLSILVCVCVFLVTLAAAISFYPERSLWSACSKNEFPRICQRRSRGRGRRDLVLHFQSNCLLQ